MATCGKCTHSQTNFDAVANQQSTFLLPQPIDIFLLNVICCFCGQMIIERFSLPTDLGLGCKFRRNYGGIMHYSGIFAIKIFLKNLSLLTTENHFFHHQREVLSVFKNQRCSLTIDSALPVKMTEKCQIRIGNFECFSCRYL